MVQATTPPATQQAAPVAKPVVAAQPGVSQPKKSKWWLWLIGIIVAFAVGIVIGMVL